MKESVKNCVVLFAGCDIKGAFEKVFDGRSAAERSVLWAKEVSPESKIVFLCTAETKKFVQSIEGSADFLLEEKEEWNCADIASAISKACADTKSSYALFSWADTPFLHAQTTLTMMDTHTRYKAEYTFSDGYPYGLTPEVIDAGCASIIAALAKDSQKSSGEKPASRDALFSIMSGDINSFEIETELAPKDYRLLRLSFSCQDRGDFTGCKNLYEHAVKKNILTKNSCAFDITALCDEASVLPAVLQTVPAFYNVQISSRENHKTVYSPYSRFEKSASLSDMKLSDFTSLCDSIADYSEKAVVSLSLFGEPLLHPDFTGFVKAVLSHPLLSVFIETDGTLVTEDLARTLSGLSKDAPSRITWCVLLDAVDENSYAKIHNCAAEDFSKALASVSILEQYFPHAVYPQMVRMKCNEQSLEPFYRFWKKADSPSSGDLIIQKYDSYCRLLSDEKSADLSPLVRNPCWHLRRDMCILSDGSVPFCKSAGIDQCAGNVLNEGIAGIWQRFQKPLIDHIQNVYTSSCRECDEYYTFNF